MQPTEQHRQTFADTASAEINRIRKLAGVSRTELARRCTALGAPEITEAALANIETGRPDKAGKRRREITIDELCILARALDIPPLLLMFPLGRKDRTEALPGSEMDTWRAALWFTGEIEYTVETADGTVSPFTAPATPFGWHQNSAPIELYRRHHDLLLAWEIGDAEYAERQLRGIRKTMRQVGLKPPTLGPKFSHVDQEAGA